MNFFIRRAALLLPSPLLLAVSLSLLLSIPRSSAQTPAPTSIPARDRMVILLSIDGFPAWLWADPALPMPTLRALAPTGATAARMTVSNPTLTWPNHTTLVTGVSPARHGVLYNGLITPQGPREPWRLEPWVNKSVLVRVPTLYDAVFQAGLTTAHVDWIPTTNSGTFNWEFPERPGPHGKIEQEMLAANSITATDLADFNTRNPAWRDVYWTRAATHLIARHHPNLLLVHLLNTDALNHKFGPGSWASHAAFAFADTCLRDIIEAVNAAGFRERATFFVTTDHGFKSARRLIRPNAILRRAGLLQTAGPVKIICDAHAMTIGGSASVFITNPDHRDEWLAKAKAAFDNIEGIARRVDPPQFAEFQLPSVKENSQMPDFILFPKPGYAFHNSTQESEPVTDVTADTYAGHHGYPNSDPDMDGVFFAWGHGIQPGTKLPRINNTDVAPTVARALGVTLPNVEGRVLEEIFRH